MVFFSQSRILEDKLSRSYRPSPRILAKLQHPFIVNMFGSFHDPRYIYMVLEYIVGGEFFTHLRKVGG